MGRSILFETTPLVRWLSLGIQSTQEMQFGSRQMGELRSMSSDLNEVERECPVDFQQTNVHQKPEMETTRRRRSATTLNQAKKGT